jgi:hypothetical protein
MPMGNFSGPFKIPAVSRPWSMKYPHTLFGGWKQQKTGTAPWRRPVCCLEYDYCLTVEWFSQSAINWPVLAQAREVSREARPGKTKA